MQNLERYALLVVIVLLLIAYCKSKYATFKKKREVNKRIERGNMLETKAKSYLMSKGFTIVNEQETFYHNFEVNNKAHRAKLILDYMAEKGGKTYIVEVKTGRSAISIDDKNTRRQILEYDFVIDSDGVLLLDMENKQLQLIKFQSKSKTKELYYKKVILYLIIALLLLLIVIALLVFSDELLSIIEF